MGSWQHLAVLPEEQHLLPYSHTCHPLSSSTRPSLRLRVVLRWGIDEYTFVFPSWLPCAALQKGLVPCNYLEPVELRIHSQQQPQVM